MNLAVVYLNYFSSNQIAESVNSLEQQIINHGHIYIGDNSSDQEEFQRLSELSSSYISVLDNLGNIGFSAGCNSVINKIEKDYDWILLLNPDTIVSNNFIESFINCAKQLDTSYSAVSPLGLKMDSKKVWSAGGKFYWQRGRADVLKIDGPSGDTEFGTCACLFVRSVDFHQLKGLNEDYFLGGEEWQLSLDIKRKLGKKVFFERNIQYEHSVSGTHEKYGLKFFYIGIRTKLLFVYKNYDRIDIIKFWFRYIPYQIYWTIFYCIKYKVNLLSLIKANIAAFGMNAKKMTYTEISRF